MTNETDGTNIILPEGYERVEKPPRTLENARIYLVFPKEDKRQLPGLLARAITFEQDRPGSTGYKANIIHLLGKTETMNAFMAIAGDVEAGGAVLRLDHDGKSWQFQNTLLVETGLAIKAGDMTIIEEADVMFQIQEVTPYTAGFFAYETIGGTEIDIAGLKQRLEDSDEADYYRGGGSGKLYRDPPGQPHGTTGIEVLPELKGLPFNNLIMAHVAALRPSKIRVIGAGSAMTCDCCCWRVTIHLEDDVMKTSRTVAKSTTLATQRPKVKKITQEVQISYGSGADIGVFLQHAKDGTESPTKEQRHG